MVEIKKFKIIDVKTDRKNVKIFTLDGERINFKPGQFVNLYLIENQSIFRQFSIASPPGNNGLEFCIKILHDGKFTSVLDKLPIGSEIGLSGPFGHFVYQEQDRCIFVAAGTGIAPIISMLRHIKEKNMKGNFTLIYSNKTEDSILYYDELKKLKKDGISVIFTLTQETPVDWQGEKGRINSSMVEKYVQNPKDSMWYACGPAEFVKIIKEFALEKGVQPEKIKIEGWG